MLIRFVVSNFMSFKEETEFNMLPSKGKGYKQHPNHERTVQEVFKLRQLLHNG